MNSTSFEPNLIIWGGIDVSGESFDLCLYQRTDDKVTATVLRKLPHFQYPRTQAGVEQMMTQLPAQPFHLVMESTGRYSLELASWILQKDPQAKVSIINPRRVLDHARAVGVRNKTDRLDAGVIATYAATYPPRPWSPASHSLAEPAGSLENPPEPGGNPDQPRQSAD